MSEACTKARVSPDITITFIIAYGRITDTSRLRHGNPRKIPKMKVTQILLILFILPVTENRVYLYHTEDSLSTEFYDCIDHQGLFYCRRPPDPINLQRDSTPWQCYHNGIVHSFASLRSDQINVSTVLHEWKSSIEKAEEYSRYLRHATNFSGNLCQCKNQHSFGKNCEYLLPMGTSFEETLSWEIQVREQHMWHVQMYGDIVCYTTLECDYGLLCLDWRDICDGIQQCMSGFDEENCDMLEFNECEDGEYRCTNGMCVPDEYFLDGDYDCMDWTDEKEIIYDEYCPFEQVSSTCDDRICTSKRWSCGDGQCILDRLGFQKPPPKSVQCYSRRDSYHMCETHYIDRLWTLPNGRCYEADVYKELSVHNRSRNQDCIYLLKCALSRGAEKHCPCGGRNVSCDDRLDRICPHQPILYPNNGTIAPYAFAFYNSSHEWSIYTPDFIEFHGTIKCRKSIVPINATRLYDSEFNIREIEVWLCTNPLGTSLLNSTGYDQYCHNDSRTFTHHFYHFIDVCNTSKECISAYRIRDGIRNCFDKMDEAQNEIVAKTCSKVKPHRFRCSMDDPTCLGVGNLGNLLSNCKNNYDESWMGTGPMFIKMNCNRQSKGDCQAIRQYIGASWTSNLTNNFSPPVASARISYRTYCDTFWNLGSKMDENVTLCQQWWVCPRDQWQCRTGQCINAKWVLDGEWDCSDASDEEALMILDAALFNRNLQVVPSRVLEERFDDLHRLQPVSHVCNISTEFTCLRTNFSYLIGNITQHRPCIRLEQIGDNNIDCYGGIDERNTIQYGTQLNMLGYNFKCSSSKTCIAYALLCRQRCSVKSDDAFWCNRRQNSSDCSTNTNDFICFNGTCVRNGRCNGIHECVYAEDEYMCDARKGSGTSLYRENKEFTVINSKQKLYLFQFPNDTNINDLTDTTDPIVQNKTPEAIVSSDLLSSSTPYQCNRGIGVLFHNNLTVCFCPPQYYGDKCEFHNDRVTVILHMNFSQSEYTEESDSKIVLKMLVLFLLRNQTLATREFHVRPAVEIDVYNKKIAHFLYSRSSELLRHKKTRYFNRSNIVNEHPYSIRIEAYERQPDERSLLVAVWQYPVYFDYLPVFRLSKVLRLAKTTRDRNPCLSDPCNQNQQCQQLLNDNLKFICLCEANYTGENCSILDQKCANGYCSPKALCKPDYRNLLTRNDQPYCICPLNQYGQRCEIVHDGCGSNRCQNDDSCFPTSSPDRVVCLTVDQSHEKNTELKRPNVKLYINGSFKYDGAVVQYFDINLSTLDLILIYQQAFNTLPTVLQYGQHGKTAPFIILVKLYHSYSDADSYIYLISLHFNVTSIYGTTHITKQNHCVHVSTLFQSIKGEIHC